MQVALMRYESQPDWCCVIYLGGSMGTAAFVAFWQSNGAGFALRCRALAPILTEPSHRIGGGAVVEAEIGF